VEKELAHWEPMNSPKGFAGVSALSHPNALKQGFLFKASTGALISSRSWSRKWFVLTPEFLLYYQDDAAPEPRGVVSLANYEKCEASDQSGAQKKNSFRLSPLASTPGRELLFCGATTAEMNAWIKSLSEALKHLNTNKRFGKKKAGVETSIYLKINEAKFNDEQPRDTYCTVMEGHTQKARTHTCYDKKQPIFSQEYEFEVDEENTLVIHLKQAAGRAQATMLGLVKIDMASIPEKVEETWHKVLAAKEQSSVSGQLLVQANVIGEKKMQVVVLAARDLFATDNSGSSDPYVVVSYGSGDNVSKQKTSVVRKNLNPTWKSQSFNFPLRDASASVRFTVQDASLNIFMGHCRLDRETINSLQGQETWLSLNELQGDDGQEVVGDLRLTLQRRKTVILPEHCYDDLYALLLADRLEMTRKLAEVSNKKEKPVAEALVKAFDAKNCATHFVKVITEGEIQATATSNILFRGNTVCTKSVDMYMRLMGTVYMQHILKGSVETIALNSKKKSCELDPNRLSKDPSKADKMRKKNLKNLTANLDMILDAITSSVVKPTNVCPAIFRNIFGEIRRIAKEKFPGDEKCLYTAASGFIFLRFFCPAILTPTSFGLLREHPSPETGRDLMLIVKTLQNLANLVVFGKKEDFMTCCNDWIERNMDKMKKFIDTLSSTSTEPIDEIQTTRNPNFGREMSRLAFHLHDGSEQLIAKFGIDDPHVSKLQAILKDLEIQTSALEADVQKVKSLTAGNLKVASSPTLLSPTTGSSSTVSTIPETTTVDMGADGGSPSPSVERSDSEVREKKGGWSMGNRGDPSTLSTSNRGFKRAPGGNTVVKQGLTSPQKSSRSASLPFGAATTTTTEADEGGDMSPSSLTSTSLPSTGNWGPLEYNNNGNNNTTNNNNTTTAAQNDALAAVSDVDFEASGSTGTFIPRRGVPQNVSPRPQQQQSWQRAGGDGQ